MLVQQQELEGTWEEIVAHAADLAGRRVHLTVLDAAPLLDPPAALLPGTAAAVLALTTGWAGDDFEECLEAVYSSRSPARF